MKKKFLKPIVLLFFLCFTTPAWAEEQAEPEEKAAETQQVIPNIGTGIIYQNAVFFRSNPAGLGEGLTAGYKRKLWDKPRDDLLFGTSYVFVGFDLVTVGIANALEAAVSIEPIALLYFRASYGTLFTSRDGNPESLYDIDLLTGSTKALARLAGSSLTQSSNLKLLAQVRLPLGPFFLRNTITWRKPVNMEAFDGSPYFYDFNYDVIMSATGTLIHNEAELLMQPSKNSYLGLRHSYTHPFTDFTEIENGDIQKFGPVFTWLFKNKPNKNHFRDHYITLTSQWYLQHPLRAADETYGGDFDANADPLQYTTSRAIPNISLLWGFGGQYATK